MCILNGIFVDFFIILLLAVTKNRYKIMAVCSWYTSGAVSLPNLFVEL